MVWDNETALDVEGEPVDAERGRRGVVMSLRVIPESEWWLGAVGLGAMARY